MKIIDKYKPDIICLGYDQTSFDLENKIGERKIKLVRLKPFKEKKFKTSFLRGLIQI